MESQRSFWAGKSTAKYHLESLQVYNIHASIMSHAAVEKNPFHYTNT